MIKFTWIIPHRTNIDKCILKKKFASRKKVVSKETLSMARKHVKSHLVKAKKHHDKHQKKLWKLFVKIAKNKNSYKPVVPKAKPKRRRKKRGGILRDYTGHVQPDRLRSQADILRAIGSSTPAQRAQMKGKSVKRGAPPPSSKAPPRKIKKGGHLVSGQGLVTGQGLRHARVRRKKTTHRGPKKPKWISRKTVPKKWPQTPKNWHKKAAGVGSWLKSAAQGISNTYNKHKDTINSIGSAIGQTALQLGTQYIGGKIQEGKQMAQAQLQNMQQQMQQQAQQAQQRVQQYTQQAQGMYQQGVQQAQQFGQAAYDRGQAYGQQAYGQAQAYGQQAYNQGRQQVQQFGQAAYDQAGGAAGYR